MESWSADMVYSLGGKKGASDSFDKLAKQGLLFTHCYSSGNRSQQGLASILGGFPALPITTLTAVPEKMRQTETITTRFNDNGYFTGFYYGGSLRYGNIKAYLIHNEFQEIEEEGDMDSSIPRGKLGIHDGYMFAYLLKKIDNVKQPFFINYFTMSSHSPYDQPMKNQIDWEDSEDDFHNSFYYSDSCLGDFIEKAKTKDWYRNTLFVIVADHSHQTYTHRSVETADYRHVPLLFVGGALKQEFANTSYEDVCSQTDIGATLLKQLRIDADSFYWSKNIMNPYSPKFAYFEINQGFGMIKPNGYVSYDHFASKYNYNTFEKDSLRDEVQKEGAAYLQTLFQEFIDL
jgi:phosphoglycerol transferase MdoB-like AlkP superfamily enzyme